MNTVLDRQDNPIIEDDEAMVEAGLLFDRQLCIAEAIEQDADELGVVASAEVPEYFRIDDEQKLNWAVRKITELRARASSTRDNAKRIADEDDARADALERFFGADIEAMSREMLIERYGVDKDGRPKKKTLQLFGGKVSFTQVAERIQVTAKPGDLVAWCREEFPDTPELVRTQTKVVEDVLMADLRPLLELRVERLPVDTDSGEVRTVEFVVIAGTDKRVEWATVKPAETMKIKE